jgi:hypothetical protein
MAIKPVNLPSGAGIDYGGGDVRHFSHGDAVNVPGLSNPTRHLAERDNVLASKVNEVIEAVNNREQFVPLPVVRTVVPPGEESVVVNYRVPKGFEARVLNAAIAAIPQSNSAQLYIYFNQGYGGSSGQAVVTCTPAAEFTGEVNFRTDGEYIVSLKNTGTEILEISASVLLTMRPLGAVGSLLVGSVIQGPRGPAGVQGMPGSQGQPGVGGAGTPGMVWQGAWVNGRSYSVNDVVSYSYSGTYGAWICRTAHTSSAGVNDPEHDTSTWNPVALGITGPQGPQGAQGAPGPAGGEPQFLDLMVNGTLLTHANYVPGNYSADYTAGAVVNPNAVYMVSCREIAVTNAAGNKGLYHLESAYKTCFKGSISLILPTAANGASIDYSPNYIHLHVMAAGTLVSYGTATNSSVTNGTYAKFFEQKQYTNGWGINVISPDPLPISIVLTGAQPVV